MFINRESKLLYGFYKENIRLPVYMYWLIDTNNGLNNIFIHPLDGFTGHLSFKQAYVS